MSGGYKPGKRIYAITFDDCPGLLIRAVSTSLGKLFEVGNTSIKVVQADPEKRMAVFNTFAKRVIEWNVLHPEPEEFVNDNSMLCARCGLSEDDPLPPTADAMQCLDLDFLMKIIMGWMQATSGITLPKELSLSSGDETTPEDQTQRLAEMQSPLTFPAPN